MQQCL